MLRARVGPLASVCLAGLVGWTTAACVRSQATLFAAPAAVFYQQLCPSLSYRVIDTFEKEWTGWGFLGIPMGAQHPRVARWVGNEVERLGGDAAVDVLISSDVRVMVFPYYVQGGPLYAVRGKVVKFDRRGVCGGVP